MILPENSSLKREINEIISNTNSGITDFKFKFILHTSEFDFTIAQLDSFELLKDYVGNISNYIVASFYIGAGDYIKNIYEHRDNLELTVIRIIGDDRLKRRYKFVILNNLGNIAGSRYVSSSQDELNKTDQIYVVGQCIDLLTEVMMSQYVDSVYSHTTVNDLLSGVYNKVIDMIKYADKQNEILINITPPDNKTLYKSIRVPLGTKIMDLGTYLQETIYGVYNGAIGNYIDYYNGKQTIFIYPLYKSDIFNTSEKKLIIYGIPVETYEYIEHSYLVDGDNVKILASSSSTSIDTAENEFMDIGSGFTYNDTNSLMTNPNYVTDGDIIVSRDAMVKGFKYKDRKDNNDKYVHIGSENNLFKYRSAVLKETMMIVQIKWNFCYPELIYPGMPVMYVYQDEKDGIIKLKGILQSSYFLYDIRKKSINAILNVMVEKKNIKKGK